MSFELVEQADDGSDGYSERLQVEGVFRFMYVAVSVGVLAGGIAIYVVFLDTDALLSPFGAFASVWWLLGVIYMIFMAFTYRELHVRVDSENLELRLGFFRSSLPVSAITGTHIGRCRSGPTFRQQIGPGILMGRGFRSWAVPFRGGVSIHMRVDGRKKLVYVSSKAPDKFKAALDRLSGINETSSKD